MLSSKSVILASASLLAVASAHFTLDFPEARGFDDDKSPDFCGGFNDVKNPRQPFPLTDAPVWIDSHHSAATVDAFLSVNDNPTSFDDFNTTSNGTSIPMVTNFFQIKTAGEFCWNVNLGDLGVGLKNGSLATLQIQYDGGDGALYQCTDLILMSDYKVPDQFACKVDATQNPTGTVASPEGSSTASASGSATSQASQASASSANTSGAAVASYKVQGWSLLGAVAGLLGVTVL